jgi:hypothetical protein
MFSCYLLWLILFSEYIIVWIPSYFWGRNLCFVYGGICNFWFIKASPDDFRGSFGCCSTLNCELSPKDGAALWFYFLLTGYYKYNCLTRSGRSDCAMTSWRSAEYIRLVNNVTSHFISNFFYCLNGAFNIFELLELEVSIQVKLWWCWSCFFLAWYCYLNWFNLIVFDGLSSGFLLLKFVDHGEVGVHMHIVLAPAWMLDQGSLLHSQT